MSRTALLVLIFSFIGPQLGGNQKKNRPPVISSFQSSREALTLCPFDPVGVCNISEAVLTVRASDPDGDRLTYRYQISAGCIEGEGSPVKWILDKAPRGSQSVEVVVSDGNGGEARATLKVSVSDCPNCDPPPPRCPNIVVSCPAEIDRLASFTFSVLVGQENGAKPYTDVSYRWETRGGKIAKGQSTPQIEVDTQGLQSETITATVEVGGFDPACSTTASCTSGIKH